MNDYSDEDYVFWTKKPGPRASGLRVRSRVVPPGLAEWLANPLKPPLKKWLLKVRCRETKQEFRMSWDKWADRMDVKLSNPGWRIEIKYITGSKGRDGPNNELNWIITVSLRAGRKMTNPTTKIRTSRHYSIIICRSIENNMLTFNKWDYDCKRSLHVTRNRITRQYKSWGTFKRQTPI